MKEVEELERKLEVARVKERLVTNLSEKEWRAIAERAGQQYSRDIDERRKLLNKVLGGKQPK